MLYTQRRITYNSLKVNDYDMIMTLESCHMNELVTIIVPVYNACNYLDRCVASLRGQTYTDLQIILVNDGSTDGSGDLCETLAAADARIEVVHIANSGVATARNAGLNRARGEWIVFADADDYLSPYFLEDLLVVARDGCDIVIGRYTEVPESDEGCIDFKRGEGLEIITGREACLRIYLSKERILYQIVWGRIFAKHIWENLRFPDGKTAEDAFVSHSLYYNAGSIAILDAALYAYVQSSNSIMRSGFTPRRFDALDMWQEGVRLYREAGDSELESIAVRVYCSQAIDSLHTCKKFMPDDHVMHDRLKRRVKDSYREAKGVFKYIDCGTPRAIAYQIGFFIGRWCPPLYSLIYIRRQPWRLKY